MIKWAQNLHTKAKTSELVLAAMLWKWLRNSQWLWKKLRNILGVIFLIGAYILYSFQIPNYRPMTVVSTRVQGRGDEAPKGVECGEGGKFDCLHVFLINRHRRRISVNFRGHKIFFAWKICIKNQQNARFLHDFCPKNAWILHNNCPRNIFPIFYWGGGTCPLSPRLLRLCKSYTSMTKKRS